MSVTRDILYLTHITETIDLIRSSGPDNPAALENDPDIRDATLYRLRTLSNSASLLSQAVKDRHSDPLGGDRRVPQPPRARVHGSESGTRVGGHRAVPRSAAGFRSGGAVSALARARSGRGLDIGF